MAFANSYARKVRDAVGGSLSTTLDGLNIVRISPDFSLQKALVLYRRAIREACQELVYRLPWPPRLDADELLDIVESCGAHTVRNQILVDDVADALLARIHEAGCSMRTELCEIGDCGHADPPIEMPQTIIVHDSLWTIDMQIRSDAIDGPDHERYYHTVSISLGGCFSESAARSCVRDLGLMGRSIAESCRLLELLTCDGLGFDDLTRQHPRTLLPIDCTGLCVSTDGFGITLKQALDLMCSVLTDYATTECNRHRLPQDMQRRVLNAAVFIRDADTAISPASMTASCWAAIEALLGQKKQGEQDLQNRVVALLAPPAEHKEALRKWCQKLRTIRHSVIHGSCPQNASVDQLAEVRLLAGCVMVAVFVAAKRKDGTWHPNVKSLLGQGRSAPADGEGILKLPQQFWDMLPA